MSTMNLSQLRDELDWQENRAAFVEKAERNGEWQARQARRRLRNVLGLALSAVTVALVYLLGIGG